MITQNSEILIEILDHLSESVQVCDEKGYFIYCNERTTELLGYSKNELIGKHISFIETTFVNPGDWERHFSLLESGTLLINRGLHKHKDGRLLPVEASVRRMIYKGENIALAIIRDIRLEYQIQKDQQMILEILKTSVSITELLLNQENTQISIYQALELLGHTVQVDRVYIFENYRHDDQIYSSITHEWVNKGISQEILNENLKNFPFEMGVPTLFVPLNNGDIINTHVRNMDPEVRPVFEAQDIISLLLIPIRIKDRFWGFIGFDSCTEERNWRQDEISLLKITANTLGMFIEKWESMSKLENMVKEKEILLSELHHRTKNNLAIISGIIDLQHHKEMSAETFAYSETIQQRVHNIALIHDLLSSSGNFSQLSFSQYVHQLLRRLETMFLSGRELNKQIQIDNFHITDLSQMVSLGILINEILLNAFKHAIQKSTNPELNFTAKILNGCLEIYIKDNGPGFDLAQVKSANTNSIGMKIINGLLKQLRANIDINTKNGTEIIIKIDQLKTDISG